MNVGGDITQLSYKELQALALRYHIPGNVKKKALIKVLQAAKSGNEAEFSRLLQELRKSRKRKTRKSKDSRLGITSTPLHSPDYMMADDDYYCQQQQQQSQQQPPYQWIGAEEEIVSKDDDTKIPHYEEFKQFLLKRIQREFQACDNNNNQVQDLSIMDLRTTPMPPNLQTIPLDESNYPKANLMNHMDPLAISSNDRPSYEILKEPESSSQGSFLLKRMLQAPVGANLGEIASSLFWASNLLDNSDTLTAESENNENENQLETNTNEYYGLLKNTRSEFLLNEANLMSQQVPNAMTNDDQYRFPNDVDNRPNSYQNWTITSVMEVPDTELQSSKVYHTIYYNNTDPAVATPNVDNNLTYQYQTDTTYNGSQNFLNFDAQDPNYGTDMIVNEPNDIYYLQNFGKHNGEMGTGYFRNVDTFGQQNNVQQNTYTNDQQYQYHYPRFTQETSNSLNERLDQQQHNVVAGMENGVNHEINATNMQRPAFGPIEPFWPKWSAETSSNLENVLNYQVSKQVDYTKLSQTSCVYCYVAPIVSQRSSLTNSGCCSVERRYTAEQRQHSFSPYWMLYNDASQGMRMTNIPNDSFVQHATTTMHTTTSNDILKEMVGDVPEAPINDVWMNQYESSSIGDDITVPISDSLFCNDISSAPTKT
ncbi:GATA zinc finger domain-containing protein 14-like isoform X2 [Nylanderia fulva]|uniref:GATA zinc finger domain-containing protein 14-like isoform X2 n=1 Tax=Nylanderia fulva TaxID=613905 RepID=UPI0010FB1EA3|nr:GATA zinc finger domain-containing protein 14-like isoform X2 [Nylanderia fulva]